MESGLMRRFTQLVMKHGKRTIAERIVQRSYQIIKHKTQQHPEQVVQQAVQNVRPVLETKTRRVAKRAIRIPVPIRPARSLSLATRWMVETAREGHTAKPMEERLAQEILESAQGRSKTVQKRKELYKTAVANRAFLRYRWA